jgi:hypothetical protein
MNDSFFSSNFNVEKFSSVSKFSNVSISFIVYFLVFLQSGEAHPF